MQNPICVPCQREMVVARIGVTVQLNSGPSRTPEHGYKVYAADVVRCPRCGAEVTKMNPKPHWERHHGEAARPKADIIVPENMPGVD